ncbi:HD-GYP domain-containing protein [Pseudalkalibacillus salsuginis]|uniref:HD-GYP domain-containing protein n=1 Tax=Pseudalkalibacillus salsuginis TaxID=2910972 RepID=UPI001F1657E1|nr:HD-GYP domain-containing protein [Pseudalkalibacillus salsuginis]MCF6410700.1 HD-GYP domain-containing protein [Pseudalkalibacillus salsuginis]
MKVLVHNLNPGEVLSHDVFSLTSRPIMTRDTELTEEHIAVLKAFFISEVEVKAIKSSSKKQNEEKDPTSLLNNSKLTDFHSFYMKAVNQYKKQFANWQAGTAVDLYPIRLEIVPLLEIALEKPKTILSLHHFLNIQDYIYHHAISVGLISSFLAKKLSYSKGDIIQLALAGALIDCGMSKIQPKIMNKKETLSQAEYEEVKQHPILGYKMLKGITGIKESVLLSVLQHHEREDGSGYPLGTRGGQLNKYSRIAAIADVFHAMTSERLYRSKQSPFKVLEQMQLDQFGKFDPKILNILVNELSAFSVGTKVELTNGQVGEIVFIDPHSLTRPMVKMDESDEIIALTKRTDLFIENILT